MYTLSICVPTFNRASDVTRQLEWLHRETATLGHAVEVIVSDNCSDDDTPQVVAEWAGRFGSVRFTSQRHESNIGWMRNFVSCYERASGRYCWIIGDDDPVDAGTLGVVLRHLDDDPELALLYLNFYGRVADTGQIINEHWFDPGLAELDPADGPAIFQRAIEAHFGAVIFISSAVIRTDLALDAIASWPGCLDNWGGMAYWCSYAARHGHVRVTAETHLECTLGQSYWQKDELAWFRIRHRDIPAVYRRMRNLGYDSGFCARKIGKVVEDDIHGEAWRANIRDAVRALVHRPLWTLNVWGSYAGSLLAAIFNL